MSGFGWLDGAAIFFFFAAWLGYHIALETPRIAAGSVNAIMAARRRAWFEEALARDNRIVDTQVMNGLQNGTAFFASTSLLAIGGAMALLQATDQVFKVYADLPFGIQTTRAAWEMKVIGLAVIFAYAFFKFSWSYRLFNYAAILLGAIPPASRKDDPAVRRAAIEAAEMNVVAGRHFNRGQRAFFFALAYLGWFLGPVPFFVATAAVVVVMWNRQFRSDAHDVLKGE